MYGGHSSHAFIIIYGRSKDRNKVHPAIYKHQTQGQISLGNFRGNQKDQAEPKTCLSPEHACAIVTFLSRNCICYCDRCFYMSAMPMSYAASDYTGTKTTLFKCYTLYPIVALCLYTWYKLLYKFLSTPKG